MISEDEVKKIAKLSRLKIDDNKLSSTASELSYIMDLVNQLNEVETKDVEPLTSVCGMKLRMRADEITEKDNRQQLFQNVPGKNADFAKEINCFVVPKVVE